jgi:hypothetical protein
MFLVISLVLNLFVVGAIADDRITQIEQALNTGDNLAIQTHIHGDYAQATLGLALEEGGTWRVIERRFTGNGYKLTVMHNDKRERWTFTECEGELSTYFCSWSRNGKGISSAAKGQALDVGTTALGVSLGFSEMNPLGLAVLPAKLVALEYADDQPYADCVTWRTWLDAYGIGAGVANIATIVAGIANPAIPIAIFAGTTALRYDSANKSAKEDCK